ncbi:hypothetical protein RRG08_038433 [Elysia crispata]|uniref:Uncharacterized protein n=1 Tax=Elysia crispata TaxID=231223 RepID=A0AAE1E1D0_9GAST|nr:hypothetical protein RRG08_038433 [Elysia crispata]
MVWVDQLGFGSTLTFKKSGYKEYQTIEAGSRWRERVDYCVWVFDWRSMKVPCRVISPIKGGSQSALLRGNRNEASSLVSTVLTADSFIKFTDGETVLNQKVDLRWGE